MKVINFLTFNHVQDRKINSSYIAVMLSFKLPGKNFLTQNEYWYNSSLITVKRLGICVGYTILEYIKHTFMHIIIPSRLLDGKILYIVHHFQPNL